MEADHVNSFVEAAINILETMASTSVKAKKPYVKYDAAAKGDISGIIDLSGDFKGTIAVSFTEKLILSIVSTMFGEEMTELNDDIKDAMGEITNMISGQVTTKLAELGKSLKAETSKVIMGKSHSIEHLKDHPVIALPYKTENGEFTIEICFEK